MINFLMKSFNQEEMKNDGAGDVALAPHQVLEPSDSSCLQTGTSVPFVLSFNNLTYSVNTRRKMKIPACFHPKNNFGSRQDLLTTTDVAKLSDTKVLLNNVSGEAREGEILAVLGASGSGKSTLIDALANRIVKESLKGTVMLNGEPLETRLLKSISAYVMQDDILFPTLTVEETLMFSAEFRLPHSFSKSKKKARVQALIDQLGLRSAANTLIGDEGHKGVSGGERRRVSIGIDIIHDPIIMFLDEPTSGLDSTNAYIVVQVLQRIARSGSIVIMSVHQPSYRIVGLLDRLIFLSLGQTVYSGPQTDLAVFFSGFGRSIPEGSNWTELALDLIHEVEESRDGTNRLVEFNKSWQNSKPQSNLEADHLDIPLLKDAIYASISRGKLVSGAATLDSSRTSTVQRFANPFWTEIGVLMKRMMKNTRRTPLLFGVRIVTNLFTGSILASLFWQLDNSPRGVQERLGFFSFAISTGFFAMSDVLPLFLQERYIFSRETAYNAYRCSSYVIAQTIVAVPSLIVLAFAFATIPFFAVGLAGGFSGFIFYYFTILASFWAGSSFVTFLSGVVTQILMGYIVVVALLAYCIIFSGFYIARNRIPSYWVWFHYISLVKYPYQGGVLNEFNDPNKCFVRGVQMFDNIPLLKIAPIEMKMTLLQSFSSTLDMNITPTTCVSTGFDFVKEQALTDLSKWDCLWIAIAWGFFFRFLFYFALLFGSKNKRS